MASATLNAQLRDGRGKGVARKLRAAGQVPAVLYGHGDANRPLTLNALEVEKLFKSIAVANTVVTLTLDGGASADALVRDVQMHPYKPEILHVDFIQLHAGEPIRLTIPVRLMGDPVGVRDDGGVLDQPLHELHIECLPRDIPDAVELDVTGLHIGEFLRVSDVSLPGVTVLHDAEITIASVMQPRVAEPEEPAAADAGSAQPELVRTESGERGQA